MKRKQQKGNSKVALITIAVVVLAVVGFVVLRKNTTPSYIPTAQQNQETSIQNDSDLQSTSNDLDNTDIDSMDIELNQNDIDASSL